MQQNLVRGTVNVPVVNVGEEDQWLKSRMVLGTLHLADVQSPSQSIQVKEQMGDQGRVAFIQSMAVESSPPSTIPGLDELKWPELSPHEAQTARTLLEKH
ncbi:hypothetical protein SKAU_G00352320 [Synaphobranchus kaupii]|uniref:Uncharacterized protein n=1 Tax=Synaphobranchus kaupii TaxID=118154 RepID=A0A9Q1EKS9_SYNKA|nr:hypothetical protein SKAU_G00352320 [Synaphobranchus kaupii]